MMLSTTFRRCAIASLGVDAFPRRRECGTTPGRRERLGPSCACSLPAPERSPRSRRAPHAPLADRVRVFARERETSARKVDALVHHRALPAMPPVDPPMRSLNEQPFSRLRPHRRAALSLTPSGYAGQARGGRRRQAGSRSRAKGPLPGRSGSLVRLRGPAGSTG